MGQSVTHRLKQVVNHPEPVDGEVVDIDTGYEETIVLTVEADGETYYETYEIIHVEKAKPTD